MQISREEAEQHLTAGRSVAFRSGDGPGRTITPEGTGKRRRTALPPEDAEGDYFLLRDEQGNLTRAGMEQVIREGGSVLYGDPVDPITTIDDLPDEVELVRGNERARAALAQSLDAQLAALAAQRARLDAQDEAKDTPAVKEAEKTKAAREKADAARQEEAAKNAPEPSPQHEADRQREAIMARASGPGEEQQLFEQARQEEGGADESAPHRRRTKRAKDEGEG